MLCSWDLSSRWSYITDSGVDYRANNEYKDHHPLVFLCFTIGASLFVLGSAILCLCISSLLLFGCQYQCNQLPGKTRFRNDLLCVEWDIKPYTLTIHLRCALGVCHPCPFIRPPPYRRAAAVKGSSRVVTLHEPCKSPSHHIIRRSWRSWPITNVDDGRSSAWASLSQQPGH